jgi:hypothetical protein
MVENLEANLTDTSKSIASLIYLIRGCGVHLDTDVKFVTSHGEKSLQLLHHATRLSHSSRIGTISTTKHG